jgi:hypothetical protein
MCAAWSYWRTRILLPPACVFQFPTDRKFCGFAPNGDVMLLTKVPDGSRQDLRRYVGPIEFWRMPEMVKVREAFTARDVFGWPRPDEQGRIVLVRDGKAWLADFNAGELLNELPGVEAKQSSWHLFNDRLISIRDDTAVVYDLTSKRVVASYPGQESAMQISGKLWGLRAVVPTRPIAYLRLGKISVIDVESGQVDHRFDHIGPFSGVQASPNGATAVVSAGQEVVVCDLPSGRRLWSMPSPARAELQFEQGSTVLVAHVLDSRRRPGTARWDARDGTVIDPLPAPSPSLGYAHFTRNVAKDGRYALEEISYKKGPIALQLSRWTYGVERWLGVSDRRGPKDRNRFGQVRDLRSGEVVGAYSFEPWDDLIAPDASGFVSFSTDDFEANRFRYYRLPPTPDWSWLVRWGVWPAVVMIGVQLLVWVSRTCRRIAPDPAEAMS